MLSLWRSNRITPICTRTMSNITGNKFGNSFKRFNLKTMLKVMLKRNSSTSNSLQKLTSTTTQTKGYRDYEELLREMIKELTTPGNHIGNPESCKWMAKVLENTVGREELLTGWNVLGAYKIVESPHRQTPENIRLMSIVARCIEMVYACFNIADDIMDGSEMRYGVPCWYRQPEVGLSAVNDSLLVSSAIFAILERYFRDSFAYHGLNENFHKMILWTCIGQYLDMGTNEGGKPKLNKMTMDRYKSIVKYKTTNCVFVLPLNMVMIMAKQKHYQSCSKANDIMLKIGELLQIQNDYSDCFDDYLVTGKHGTDIQEGKCTWLAVTALERANKSQREVMEKFYGSKTPEDIARVKNLYEELNIKELCESNNTEYYNSILKQCSEIKSVPREVFLNMVDSIYRGRK